MNLKVYERKRYLKRRKKVIKDMQRRRKLYPKEYKAIQQRYVCSDWGRYARFVYRARHIKFIPVSISFKFYCELIKSPCHYCGGQLPTTGIGLDRIDSRKGYSVRNIHPCCTQCNISKNDWTEKEFKKWVNKIYHHWIMRTTL